ncbi:MAG TPA: LPS export ABC transporter periplasmic protein LptC [Methyloceanibacter sp.]|jgi:lipopolysaccharide export system protein LptC|nr:LPS export ABC transporter periplasmic protein LptC [Methyloceanibacter sp.]
MAVDADVIPSGGRYLIRTEAERARAFRSAERHSRLVAFFRKGLPIFAMLVLASYFISSRLSVSVGVGDLTASIEGVEVSDGNLRMTNPKLEGADKKNGKYLIGADYADQDMRAPHKIKLHAIKAELTTAEGGWSRMNAARGVFNNRTEKLLMLDKITVATSSGITGELKRASLDMKNQTLRSHQPVWFTLTRGSVKASALTFQSSESTLTFRGKVHVHLIKKAKNEKDEKTATPKAEPNAPTVVPPLPEATGAVSESTGALSVGTQ